MWKTLTEGHSKIFFVNFGGFEPVNPPLNTALVSVINRLAMHTAPYVQ